MVLLVFTMNEMSIRQAMVAKESRADVCGLQPVASIRMVGQSKSTREPRREYSFSKRLLQ
jgi:hypothetical protein